jgi:hypothetical protein
MRTTLPPHGNHTGKLEGQVPDQSAVTDWAGVIPCPIALITQ